MLSYVWVREKPEALALSAMRRGSHRRIGLYWEFDANADNTSTCQGCSMRSEVCDEYSEVLLESRMPRQTGEIQQADW